MNLRTVFLTRRLTFCAAHKLYSKELSPEENLRIFDKCSYGHGHGHNYELFVTLKGNPDPLTGMVMNTSDLTSIVKKHVLDPMDHRYLNYDIPEFEDVQSTMENLVIVIWDRLFPDLGELLFEIKIQETENNVAYYRGE